MMALKIGNDCLNPRESLTREWLETNGAGSYSSSTLLHCHTRKYHGLLVADFGHPAGRQVMLSKFEDSLVLGEEEHFFTCHQYPGFFFPPEPTCLSAVRLAPAPRFTYSIGKMAIHKTLLLLRGKNCLLIRYELENAPAEMMLRLKPFIACRGYHGVGKQNIFFSTGIMPLKNGFSMEPYRDMPPLSIRSDSPATFTAAAHWYCNFEYLEERERGYEWREDLFMPGLLEIPVKNGRSVTIAIDLTADPSPLRRLWEGEMRKRSQEEDKREIIVAGFPAADRDILRQLLRAGDQFLIRSGTGRAAVIAGYHWFGDWGRDSLISLPGLTFCCGRVPEGIAILVDLGKYEKEGLLPNFFSPGGKNNAYNTVDASLWFFWAVQQMLKYGGSIEIVRESLWPVMKNIVRNFMAGTNYSIHMLETGLLHAGDGNTHLTWMDAQSGGKPVTPRGGLAVEINALWYNALRLTEELGRSFGESLFAPDLPERVARAFQDTFWIEGGSYLGDVYADGVLDHAIRPNQIFALSLPFTPLTPLQAEGVLNCVREHLLTPCGLRTLAPADKDYRGRYEGNQDQRDAVYHQGTVWPWLLGAYGEASLRFAADRQATRLLLLAYLRRFLEDHLKEAGLGTVSEIFDGDPPHSPRGCISQAWSVGELIRLYSLIQEP